ncbi:MAG: cytochrome c peroxidase [Pseudomonadota bacterium]
MLTAQSDRGVYEIHLTPDAGVVPISEMHNWRLRVTDRNGVAFFPTQLAIQGGMPGHGHGFPVEPQASRYLESGEFLVEGVFFNMAGDWQIRVGVEGPSGWDTATFVFAVSPQSSKDIQSAHWTSRELDTLRSLQWSKAGEIPRDISNRYDGNFEAVRLGELLFHDPKLSQSGQVSCASCHQPQHFFTDGKARSFGSAQTLRHTPSLLGVARQRWFYWDGRRDTLWAQALTPLETQGEMDNNRSDVVHYVLDSARYRTLLETLVGELPDVNDQQRFPAGAGPFSSKTGKSAWQSMAPNDQRTINGIFSAVGKSIAAFEATLDLEPSRFDRFVSALFHQGESAAQAIIQPAEQRGLKLFLDQERTQCLRCHNGPMLSNGGFHNIGTGQFSGENLDFGRIFGLRAVHYDEFNCRGQYSDAENDDCIALRFGLQRELPAFIQGAFKVPTLRNVANTAPYFHDGRYATLKEVVAHYRDPPGEGSELDSLPLSDRDIQDMVEFMQMLSIESDH